MQVPWLGVEASGPPLASLGPRRVRTFALIRPRVGGRRHGAGGSGGRSHGAVTLNKGRRGPGPGEAQNPGRGPCRGGVLIGRAEATLCRLPLPTRTLGRRSLRSQWAR